MRKKKECIDDKSVIRKGKYKKKTSSNIKNRSIIEFHENKMGLYTNNKVKDRLNDINKRINLKKQIIEKKKKESEFIDLYNDKLELNDLQKELNIIKTKQDMTEYLLDSNTLLQKYLKLEQEENALLVKDRNEEDNNTLNDIIKEKNIITYEYFSKFAPEKITRKVKYADIFCQACKIPYSGLNGFNVCLNCGLCNKMIETCNEMSYKETQEYDIRPQFTYEKASHLADWLRRFTASEGKIIPQEILDKVIMEAHKERFTDLSELDERRVKRYLKKLNLNEYYENVISIINRINKRPPFNLPIELEEKIKIMFSQIQKPFEKYKPTNRKNFLSYSYCLHQFFKILGLPEFCKYFTLLKSYDKLRQQDEIFKKIVAEMAMKDNTINWKFYPTI